MNKQNNERRKERRKEDTGLPVAPYYATVGGVKVLR